MAKDMKDMTFKEFYNEHQLLVSGAVAKALSKYPLGYDDYFDLWQDIVIDLYNSRRYYDNNKCSISTCLYRIAAWKANEYINRKKNSIMPVPRGCVNIISTVRKYCNDIENITEKEYNFLQERFKISKKKVDNALKNYYVFVSSIDEQNEDCEYDSGLAGIVDEREQLDNDIFKSDILKMIDEYAVGFTQKRRDIFYSYYKDGLTMQEIAKLYNTSFQNVSQILKRSIKDIRRDLINV